MLDLEIRFDEKKLVGSIEHTFRALVAGVQMLQLDVQDLKIVTAYEAESKTRLETRLDQWPWITDEANQVLTVYLAKPLAFNETIKVKIEYSTSPDGLGLNWLNEKQTDSKMPFFYTDCQTYYCRSVAPLQDTPAVKAPYRAKLRITSPLIALASGRPVAEASDGDYSVFEYQQPNPVPSYLIAVLGGRLERRAIDKRTFVYAEPGMISRSAEVLSDIGDFLNLVRRMGKGRSKRN